MSRFLVTILPILLVLWALPAAAEVHRVRPPDGSAAEAPDGSPGAPWPSVEMALASGRVAPGDELLLEPGEYGAIAIGGAVFAAPVLIRPDLPGTVRATSLRVTGSRHLTIEGLSVWPDGPGEGYLVRVRRDSEGIVLRGLDVRSREDAATYPAWSRRDWVEARRNGVSLNGSDNALLDSRLTGLSFAISTSGPHARVAGNLVMGFSGDGMRGLGDDSVFEGNRVQDCVQIDGNHADAFQSWSRGGPDGRPGLGTVEGLVLRGNVLVEWAQPTDNPLRCGLQAIGLFDGMFRDLLIENNVIMVSAFHGIAVTGGLDVTIVGNTLVNPRRPGADHPWISVTPHKDGTSSADVVVANNMAPRFRLMGIDPARLVDSRNVIGLYPAQQLAGPYDGRFDPLPDSLLIDGGDPRYAPRLDILGRPRDASPDIGAYEGPAP